MEDFRLAVAERRRIYRRQKTMMRRRTPISRISVGEAMSSRKECVISSGWKVCAEVDYDAYFGDVTCIREDEPSGQLADRGQTG